jgi:hypothetical protein
MIEILTFKDVAGILKKHKKTIKRYTQLPENPLPIHRPKHARPYFIPSETFKWIKSNLPEE